MLITYKLSSRHPYMLENHLLEGSISRSVNDFYILCLSILMAIFQVNLG